ncbi:MerR family transcriptional regulator [Dactylosporangium sp. NPDC005572]|uniref:MerR family transcriptional regulator n=1 Tax=Dactylosporangium sp. NPDC005572 TaxID=3156889 RepID=UPI0033B3495A
MQIGELAQATGASVRALRHYEDEGLIQSSRDHNGYRIFGTETADAVRRIRRLLEAGLPTRLIRELLPHLDGPADLQPDQPCDYFIGAVTRQRDQLDRRIEALTRNRDAIAAYLRSLTLT